MDRMTTREERQLLSGALIMALALIGLVMLFASGCATWQATAARTVLGVESGARAARALIAEPCSTAAMKTAVDECIAAGDKACAPLRRCEVARKTLHSLFTAILIAKLSIQAGDEATAQASVTAAIRAVGPVMRSVEVWK